MSTARTTGGRALLPPARHHLLEEVHLPYPFWRAFELHYGRPYAFLLDSANPIKRLGRYSFLGSGPSLVFRAKRRGNRPADRASIELGQWLDAEGGRRRAAAVTRWVADPFAALGRLLALGRPDEGEAGARPVPFLGGAVGYFGYEAGYFVEALPDRGADDLGLPDICFAFHDSLLAHDHEAGRTYLSVCGRGRDAHRARRRARQIRDRWLARLRGFAPRPIPPRRRGKAADRPPEVRSHFDQAAYGRAVETCRQHILAGDVFEVCMTRRLEAPYPGDAWELYRHLRRISPAPFACFLDYPEAKVLCSSPERFVHLGADRMAESRPIKGTRPRGRTREEDERLRRQLETSAKDRAENMMIVDLVRNDLGRVAEPGTVHVPELMAVEPYATVFQMVSTVRGRLGAGFDGLDLVKACFPGGSMTGAPKIEAMKIIDRLEPVKRGIYSGAIGYLDFSGPLDLNIVIRTMIVKDGRCYFHAGGAVVADSDPAEEFEETAVKARAMTAALAAASGPGKK